MITPHAPAMHNLPPRTAGFTLIEVVVVLAILSILAAIAFPAFQRFLNANRISGAAEELSTSIQLARSEAVRRNAPVRVCATTDGTSCATAADWSSWVMLGNDRVGNIENEVIRSGTAPSKVTISGPSTGLTFRASGLVDAESSVTVCMPITDPSENQRVLKVMVSGSVRTESKNGGGACP